MSNSLQARLYHYHACTCAVTLCNQFLSVRWKSDSATLVRCSSCDSEWSSTVAMDCIGICLSGMQPLSHAGKHLWQQEAAWCCTRMVRLHIDPFSNTLAQIDSRLSLIFFVQMTLLLSINRRGWLCMVSRLIPSCHLVFGCLQYAHVALNEEPQSLPS